RKVGASSGASAAGVRRCGATAARAGLSSGEIGGIAPDCGGSRRRASPRGWTLAHGLAPRLGNRLPHCLGRPAMTAHPQTLDEAACVALATQLRAAHRARAAFVPVAVDGLPLRLDDAYRVQDHFVHLLSAEQDAGVAGYKIGLTSAAMQEMCGIDHPVHGRI